MDFVTFARANGVVINSLLMDGRWHRVPTLSHPHKRNGAYQFKGDVGFVMDWASMTEASVWTPEGNTEGARVDAAVIAARAREVADRIRRDQAAAAARAEQILSECERAGHPYLVAKGFDDAVGSVWWDDRAEDLKLCIPMRVDGRVVGVQTISDQPAHQRRGRDGELEDVPAFEKKFQYGQRIDLSTFTFGRGAGMRILCEGYATGLSISRALESLRQQYTLMVCFTAGNMRKVAAALGESGIEGIVVADNDKPNQQFPGAGGTGIGTASVIGWPFWSSDREGEDANDYEKRRGTFALAMGLKPLVMRRLRA